MAELPQNFLEMLDEANSIVTADYPQAELFEASINLTLLGAPWQFVFGDPATSPASTVILKNFEGQFQTPPQYIDSPWGDDNAIPLPITLDLQEALSLCEQKGCGSGNPDYITLRWPLYPGDTEPFYIVTWVSANQRCFVGVNTQNVQCDAVN
ncbi:MAG TPA: hypothetical protein VF517_18570 [Thermoleophilaceae bacterium]|jgi:hypothetical protein